MAREVQHIRKWLEQFNSEAAMAVYGQGDGAALIECGGHRFFGVGGETQVRYDRQPLKLAIEKLRHLLDSDMDSMDVTRAEIAAVLECLEPSEPMCTCGEQEGDHKADCPRARVDSGALAAPKESSLPPAAANAPVQSPSTDPKRCGFEHYHSFGHWTCNLQQGHPGRHQGDGASWDSATKISYVHAV